MNRTSPFHGILFTRIALACPTLYKPYPFIDRKKFRMLIHGQCHCGTIDFTLDWTPEPAEIPARACTCSFCSKHGGVWTAAAQGRLELRIADSQAVSRYAFGTRTAEFLVCRHCGVVPACLSVIDGRTYAVISVNAIDNVDPARFKRASVSFDDEALDDRLDRRQRHWIANVTVRENTA